MRLKVGTSTLSREEKTLQGNVWEALKSVFSNLLATSHEQVALINASFDDKALRRESQRRLLTCACMRYNWRVKGLPWDSVIGSKWSD